MNLRLFFYVSVLFICVGILAQSATQSGLHSLTTLPPAMPTGNNPDPCAFPDRDSLLDRIAGDLNNYNISLLIDTCPDVCQYIYGSGNPDISGIGVSV